MTRKKIVRTDRAPAAIGPYSQGVAAGGFLFLSGQIPLDPATGQVVEGPVEQQVERVLENLKEVLQAAGAGLEAVVKTTVYLTDLGEFSKVNEVYGRYFRVDPPARATIEVAALPKGVKVEIDAVASLEAGEVRKRP